MLKRVIYSIFLFALFTNAFSQTKIGGAIGPSDANAFLEIGDATGATKGLLLPRVDLSRTDSPSPLGAHVKGMLVYNKTTNGTSAPNVSEGIYYNDGTKWLKIIDSSTPLNTTNPSTGLSNADNGLSVSGGNTAQLGGALIKPTTISTSLANTLTIAGLQLGDKSDGLIVANADGVLRKISFNELISNLEATNGLEYDAATRKLSLGGALTKPTVITTTATNTLAIQGLQSGTTADNVVVADAATGVLKTVPASSFNAGGNDRLVKVYKAIDGQMTFSTPISISNLQKVQVYRNGVEVNFKASGTNQITLDFSSYDNDGINSCFAGDEIKVCQWQ